MLPIPNLDDRLYEEIVADARRSIPRLIPQWTDENAHDPGITMLELFSWLTEMQQYYLNRVTAKNERKFLQLLGVTQRLAASARADVTFSGAKEPLRLPRGLKLQALDESFETTEPLWAIPHVIQRVLVTSDIESADYTAANENGQVGFYAFGLEAKRGTRLLLGFDQPLLVGQPISLTFNLREEHAIARNSQEEEGSVTASAQIGWYYFGPDNAWHKLQGEQVVDGTNHFSQSGRVILTLSEEMGVTTIHPANDQGRAWIACYVEQDGYEVSPMIEKCTLNTVNAVHSDTHSHVLTFDSDGSRKQIMVVDDYLAYFGQVDVQVREPGGGWRDWKQVESLADCGPRERCYELVRDATDHSTRIQFGDGSHGRIPPWGKGTVRIIACAYEFVDTRWIGHSNGLSHQRFTLPLKSLLQDTLLLQVGEAKQGLDGIVEWQWQDWAQVDDLERSRPDDCHYRIDLEAEEIVFGDHEYGQIPNKSAEYPNIRILAYRTGGGERGNVQQQRISGVIAPAGAFPPELSVINHFFASGGRERETLSQAKERLRQEMRLTTRAITADDYERIAMGTPGLRVARVKALPLYRVGQDDPSEQAAGQVTVVVVPFSYAAKPMPSPGFLQTVERHLHQHRLLTTEVHVVPPEYVKITVNAVIVVHPDAKHQSGRILEALRNFLDVLDERDPTKGWEFGRAVYKGDVYGIINRLPGVEYIQSLWLDAEGRGIHRDTNGDIHLPPHGLVYSGAHTVQLLSRHDL